MSTQNGPTTVPAKAYQRTARFSKSNEAVVILWAFEPHGQIAQMILKQEHALREDK